MNLKEIIKEVVIKFLKNLNADKDKIDNVINFLRRGWEYEEMWEELRPHKESLTGKNHKSLGTVMWDIEQKHSLKE